MAIENHFVPWKWHWWKLSCNKHPLHNCIEILVCFCVDVLLPHHIHNNFQTLSTPFHSVLDIKKIHFIPFCFRQLTEYFFAKSTFSDDDNGKKPAKKKLEAQDKASDRPGRFSAQGEEGLDPIPPYPPL